MVKTSCGRALKAAKGIEFYNSYNADNYARTFGREFGREGNPIFGDEAGSIRIWKSYYAQGAFRWYGLIECLGANVVRCLATTNSGVCDQVEYADFGLYLSDYLNAVSE